MVCFLFNSSTALASSANRLCEYYSPKVITELRAGSQRDIGEIALLTPLACRRDRLLFSDTRFRTDNQRNREVNFGLTYRQLYDDGIWGSYGYFDRKRSGSSDKFYSQMTIGQEWLAHKWDTRANAYIPLSDEKNILDQSFTPNLSTPTLSGSNISFLQFQAPIIREKPLYGFDVEAGRRIADTNFWVYGAGYHFDANDVNAINGGRVRARFDVNQNLSLLAESQYDEERGRQSWAGFRLTMPLYKTDKVETVFSEKSEKSRQNINRRMMEIPVRDIDIVTKEKTTSQAPKIIYAKNIQTNESQRIIYVDNTAVSGGIGTLERPFNNLTEAQNALNAHDILYIANGDGADTNYNTGLIINKSNVRVLGSGNDLIYDQNLFSLPEYGNSSHGYNGLVLKQATDRPIISSGTNGIEITSGGVSIQGVAIQNAGQNGIYARSNTGSSIGDLSIDNVTITNSTSAGISVLSDSAGSAWGVININNTSVGNNGAEGVLFQASNGALISQINMQGINSNGNTGINGHGVYINAQGSGTSIHSVTAQNLNFNSNSQQGIYVLATFSAQLDNVSITDINTNSNTQNGIYIHAQNSANIDNLTIEDSLSNGNQGRGAYVYAQNTGQIDNIQITRLSASHNTGANGRGLELRSETSSARIDNAALKNINAFNNQQQGIYVFATTSAQIGEISLEDITGNGNSNRGLYIQATDNSQISELSLNRVATLNNTGANGRGVQIRADVSNSSITSVSASNITARNNAGQGVLVEAFTTGDLGTVTLNNVTSTNNTGSSGVGVEARIDGSGSSTNTLDFRNIVATNNGAAGVRVWSSNSATISTATIQSVTSNTNAGQGIYTLASSAGNIGNVSVLNSSANQNTGSTGRGVEVRSDAGTISNASLNNITSTQNAQHGLNIYALSAGNLTTKVESFSASLNSVNGVFVDDDTTGTFVVDLGGGALSSTGQNQFFSNTGTDIRADMDNGLLRAENNWWGDVNGLQAGRQTLDGTSTIDASPFLTTTP